MAKLSVKFFLFFILILLCRVDKAIAQQSFQGSLQRQFSGVVLKMKATEIETLENSGFVCPVPGQTLTIRQKGKSGYQPTSYVVFAHTKSKTLTPLAVQQKIIGKYGTKYPIVCVLEAVPPVVQVVMLDMITLYGNSKQ